MPHFPYFRTLPKIWLLKRLLFLSREGRFSYITYQRNTSVSASKFSNFVTRLDIRITKKVYFGKDGQHMAQHLTATHVTVTELTRKIEGHGHKLYKGQFLFFPWIIWWLGQETDLLLWQCQAEQERHATRPSTEDNKTENRRHSSKNQGWLDGNTVVGQERHLHVDEYSQFPSRR